MPNLDVDSIISDLFSGIESPERTQNKDINEKPSFVLDYVKENGLKLI